MFSVDYCSYIWFFGRHAMASIGLFYLCEYRRIRRPRECGTLSGWERGQKVRKWSPFLPISDELLSSIGSSSIFCHTDFNFGPTETFFLPFSYNFLMLTYMGLGVTLFYITNLLCMFKSPLTSRLKLNYTRGLDFILSMLTLHLCLLIVHGASVGNWWILACPWWKSSWYFSNKWSHGSYSSIPKRQKFKLEVDDLEIMDPKKCQSNSTTTLHNKKKALLGGILKEILEIQNGPPLKLGFFEGLKIWPNSKAYLETIK